jgi:hypothetical protein
MKSSNERLTKFFRPACIMANFNIRPRGKAMIRILYGIMPKTSRTHPSNYRNFMKHTLQLQNHRYAYKNEYKLPLKIAMRMIIRRITSLPHCSTAAYTVAATLVKLYYGRKSNL